MSFALAAAAVFMTATSLARGVRRPAILVDLGGVLVHDHLAEAAQVWGARLGLTPDAFLAALFAGNDERILIGRVGEADWWRVVAGRLGAGGGRVAEIRADLAARHTWNLALLNGIRSLRGRASVAVVSNAWPDMRGHIEAVPRFADAIVLSCEAGHAKPDPRIYEIALDSLAATAGEALFIDDTAGHVAAAQTLGLDGHVHRETGETLARIADFVSPGRFSPAARR